MHTTVLLADVTDMFDGQRTAGVLRLCVKLAYHTASPWVTTPPAAFKEHAKKFSNRGPLSFSLACGDGTTLDVIVGSEVKKRLWMTCLRTLLEREARACHLAALRDCAGAAGELTNHACPLAVQPLSFRRRSSISSSQTRLAAVCPHTAPKHLSVPTPTRRAPTTGRQLWCV